MTLDSGVAFFRYSEECDDDVCETCYDRGGISPHRVVAESVTPPSQPADNFFGILKVAVITGQRRFGGVITGMLACGVVAKVRLTAGAKSATHSYVWNGR